MERQGLAEGTQSEETGLEEPMWQLELGTDPYPERPGEPDCIYYLRTGSCGYGDRCRFNHPRHRSMAMAGRRVGGGDYPERVGQPACQYYMKTGTCKFGPSCKYHHPRQGASVVNPFALNAYGYPLRPGEKECSYYMKTGHCKFGMTCKFHHPEPASVQMLAVTPAAVSPAPVASPGAYHPVLNAPAPSPTPQQFGVVPGNWPVARPHMMPGSYIQGPYGPLLLSPGVVPFPAWAPHPAPSPGTIGATLSAVGGGQLYGVTPLSPSAPAYMGPYSAVSTSAGPSSSTAKDHTLPQRPGQPECQFYLKTGDCKFGSSCKYHHPAEWVAPETSSALSAMGLPLRPGTPTCRYYLQHGVCKFGPTCKFDHPMGTLSYSPSTSSLSDMPVAPYPVGSSVGTLAPSSSSSDLRTEVIQVSAKVSPPVLSSGSGGSVSSKSGLISQSIVQETNQSPPASSSSPNGTAHSAASS